MESSPKEDNDVAAMSLMAADGGGVDDSEAAQEGGDAKNVDDMRSTLQLIRQHIVCCVCLSIFVSPVLLPCSHIVCEGCARREIESGNKRCPLCKSGIGLRNLRPDGWLARVVQAYHACLREFDLPFTQHTSPIRPPPRPAIHGAGRAHPHSFAAAASAHVDWSEVVCCGQALAAPP
ncbi:unnamed protein product, partial [Phaeothamnion confervicola]